MKSSLRIIVTFSLVTLLLFSTACGLIPLPTLSDTTTGITTSTTWKPVTQNNNQTYLPNFIAVVEKIRPSVVTVETDLATATGWIVDSTGIIVTNNHVIESAAVVHVTLADGRELTAQSVQTDAFSDLAIIRVNASGLVSANIGNSASLRVGEPVAAIGNSLGEGISMKGGWISRLNVTANIEGQVLFGLLETDAAINAGNSGGPLVNMAGEVIGITNAKLVEVGVEGIGYAISIDSAVPVIRQLIEKGSVMRPFLGVGNMRNASGGVSIGEVIDATPAALSGLQAGDIIISIDDIDVSNADDLFLVIQGKKIGQRIKIVYTRSGVQGIVYAVLMERPY
jgi:serine protease Do